ncbi:carboxylate/amino acid/amine transporter [Tritonibacter multivorans]|uniref:Carboxylate/amino acid/amine transporter n=1 Tax=Tritonibacter multivorans TaxID=928856 RepID=A0A0P1GTQ2_9RHOB|nr:DMT family transporter [Tritonibacter multivorans]MDA7421760.1 DMT family transporter [Tritonibacter multivorans]CUH77952.1 carboxylate/amino acid/amine transporter [Tritonibacter multivorans]SFD04820.1 Threonine/homoserine efflux transporter RhtA [Tritonibacter multivorans]
MTQDRPFLGVSLMLGFCVTIPACDAMAKLLGATLPVGQIVFARFAFQAALLVPLAFALGSLRMPRRILPFVVLRTLLQMAGVGAMFTAFKHLPLADAVAIAFVMPFIMLVLGKYVLGEEVGIRRLGACSVGFTGTLLVIQPSFAAVGWHALWPVLVAVIFALFMLVTRKIAKETEPISLQAVSGLLASGLMVPLLWLGEAAGGPGLNLTPPPADTWVLLTATGVLGTFAHLLMTWSLRFAPTATLASMQYLEIPVAVLLGWMIFGDLPNALAALGIGLTISAGLYAVLRERRAAAGATRVTA